MISGCAVGCAQLGMITWNLRRFSEWEGGREVGRHILHTVCEINAWSDMVINAAADQREFQKKKKKKKNLAIIPIRSTYTLEGLAQTGNGMCRRTPKLCVCALIICQTNRVSVMTTGVKILHGINSPWLDFWVYSDNKARSHPNLKLIQDHLNLTVYLQYVSQLLLKISVFTLQCPK